ncbi:homoserine O-succinyltransferase [Lactobacillus sp. S2-2]|uniref:homoserine O-acetyltransferase/O-succinyltransferase family protein n=1 Tax=Lactobacillus sp. S2-2 TaxID=2692917 RepID=UPI001F33D84F|nr:homoserine O-succinyltransferase [Lactobacillus sp. S2-2]MCF6515308.1 homoserine O-succinyltransferase [Lactobacillus sp. S2-2]
MNNSKLIKIGILNLMHDKLSSKNNFDSTLKNSSANIEITYFYPITKYTNQKIPDEVKKLSNTLNLNNLADFDGFIISGAPIDKLEFDQVYYFDEIKKLINQLNKLNISQLYICWGAMAALHHLYGFNKNILPNKFFGVYPHYILNNSSLIGGLKNGFQAPHARYAEMDLSNINSFPKLKVVAETTNRHAFLIENQQEKQIFLFSHLEYNQNDLYKEYLRETKSSKQNKKAKIVRPKNYINDISSLQWQYSKETFFNNWIKKIT